MICQFCRPFFVLLVFCLSFIVLGSQLVAIQSFHQKVSKNPVKKRTINTVTKRHTALLKKELKEHFIANKKATLRCPKRFQEDKNVRD